VNQLVECVPNFSEGRDSAIIKEITQAIETVSGIKILDVDMGADTNRTVVTIIGSPDVISEAAFQAVKKASEVIDMSKHEGAHPRMGATDVCPFIPVSNITMDECIEIARKTGKRIGEELGIPIYLYEKAAKIDERKNLATVRAGEYEGFKEKIKDSNWKPDYGTAKFNEKSGATAVGAREFLIAYNINLNTNDRTYANEIAYEIRERGRWKRTGNISPFYYKGEVVYFEENKYPDGNSDFVATSFEELSEHYAKKYGKDLRERYISLGLNPDDLIGKPVYKDGRFTNIKGLGWIIPEYNRAQISMNLTNYKISAIHDIYDAVCEEAEKRGIRVTGSEIVGLIPYDAMKLAAEHYLSKMHKSPGLPIPDLMNIAIQSLGLSDVSDFSPKDKVLGMPKVSGELVNRITFDFIDEVSRDSAAPGGGSVAALSGALGAALGTMVANLSISKSGFEKQQRTLANISQRGQNIKDRLVQAVDDDTSAFDKVIKAMRMPKDTEEEKDTREIEMQKGYQIATLVPLETVKDCKEALEICYDISKIMDDGMASDVGSGACMANAGAISAAYNVRINIKSINDLKFCERTKDELNKLLDECSILVDKISNKVEETF
jgi:glutamate formiminotransferase/formiminotetrahydrofolate cyclodeaminase|tara:strand:- start:159 stop:1979 length:1821 start_codon:yes stop_codon:yes gene_type:complete